MNGPLLSCLYPLVQKHVTRAIAAGAVVSDRVETIFLGDAIDGLNRPPDEDTLFEIGSITKTFTALLLADMSLRGEVALDDPIGAYLPEGVKTPRREDGRQITLLDLATHSAGLPNGPEGVDLSHPEGTFGTSDLEVEIGRYRIEEGIGQKASCSTLGFGLLGHVLSLAAGRDFNDLVVERICEPLGMGSTRIRLSAQDLARTATGHEEDGKPVLPEESLEGFLAASGIAGGGALRSTLADMLAYLRAMLGPEDTPLTEAIRLALRPRIPFVHEGLEGRDMRIGLGWIIEKLDGRAQIWHNGGTLGYRSYMAFDPSAGVGVVVLSNTVRMREPDEAGGRIMEALVQGTP